MTGYGEAFQRVRGQLRGGGIENPRQEANALFEILLNIPEENLLAQPWQMLSDEQDALLSQAVRVRLKGYPLQYIVGRWPFYGYDFYVGEGVLIPRSDTEILVDEARKLMEAVASPVVADLCSGTGCVGIVLALLYPIARVKMVEKFDAAIHYLSRNMAMHQVENGEIIQSDIMVAPQEEQIYDVLLSNPPYIPQGDLSGLQREVRFEPVEALDGGGDGLMYYRAIARRWKKAIKPGGALLFEVGAGQWEAVEDILLSNGYERLWHSKDYNNIIRVVGARRPR